MKFRIVYVLITVLVSFSSCGIKEKYKNCEEASDAVGETYTTIVKAWGEPDKKVVDLNRFVVDCLWKNVTEDNSKVGISFSAYDPYDTGELKPLRSKSYIGCESVDEWF